MAHDDEISTEVDSNAIHVAPNKAETKLSSNSHTSNARSENDDARKAGNQRGPGRDRASGRGRDNRGGQGGRQKKEMGRKEWSRHGVDKRKRNQAEQAAKRQKITVDGIDALPPRFTNEEIAAEERKPKRKVAVLIGYAGSGYKGMQINKNEKTIEGDIFSAFISAGAISKANSDDPKKSSLVRCARTDKGVHAAGNVISLKLIVEDPDIVKKVNAALPPQIRIWGFERTTSSFSCYQLCDSRCYEYLIPTYSFLPPHPHSFLAKKLVESAEKENTYEKFHAFQEDVANFWEEAEKTYVNPILEKLDPMVRKAVMESIHTSEDVFESSDRPKQSVEAGFDLELKSSEHTDGDAADKPTDQVAQASQKAAETSWTKVEAILDPAPGSGDCTSTIPQHGSEFNADQLPEPPKNVPTSAEAAIKEVKAAYIKAKKAYRISTVRRERIQEALSAFVGTNNFHNYTVSKDFKDPSARRVIRSFKVSSDPIIINGTQWLSLKVHGQSFMMHQIRKMVAMAAMVVRCGCPVIRINESYGPDYISIPKAPGLGLLLERPVFHNYNKRIAGEHQKEKIDFDKFNEEINEFKRREIYERIFREEEKDHQFLDFFHYLDHYQSEVLLWSTSTGISASTQRSARGERANKRSVNIGVGDSEDEDDTGHEEG